MSDIADVKNVAIVEIERGLVTNIYTSVEDLEVYVLDRDIEEVSDDATEYNKELTSIAQKLKRADAYYA